MKSSFLKTRSLILLPFLAAASVVAQVADPSVDEAEEPSLELPPNIVETAPPEPEPEVVAEVPFEVAEEMNVFKGHIGRWRGDSKTIIHEGEERHSITTRSVWNGGFLLGGQLFQIQGYSYGELRRTDFRWHYSFDSLKERYMGVYHDSNGRTAFFEGVLNPEKTKIVWRLIHGPGDMEWEVETDLVTEDGIETTGKVLSEDYAYNMIYGSLFKRETTTSNASAKDVPAPGVTVPKPEAPSTSVPGE